MPILLLIPFAIVLVVLSVLGFAGIGPLNDERRADRDGVLGAFGPAVGLLLGGILLAVAVIGSALMIGLGRGDDGGDRARRAQSTTSTQPPRTPGTTPTTASSSRPAVPGAPRSVALGPTVAIEADGADTFPASYDVADGLAPATVLRMRVTGFEPFARGVAQQCAPTLSRPCANRLRVQFDADGVAEFQYLVTDGVLDVRWNPGRCRAGAPPCTVVVRAREGGGQGEIQTVFGDRVRRAGHISVTPASGLSLDGEAVTVEVVDYPPGAQVTAMLCAAPDAIGARCGSPGPNAPLLVGADGSGRAKLAIEPGRVGPELAPCFRGDDCGISVASDEVFTRAPVVPISFAPPPGAAYDPTRLLLGLGVALVLLGIAAVLLLRTDWAPVGEAAAPEIDEAEYADLDAIIAALPPLEDESVPVS